MNREDRAKQFLAFDALKGLTEELKKREEKRLRENKRELSEEWQKELSEKVAVLSRGDEIKVTFFYNGHYVDLSGKVQDLNIAYKYLKICDNKISFSDIYQINTEK